MALGLITPAIQHAIKKLLAGGKRGYKGEVQDYEEAIASIKRGIELVKEPQVCSNCGENLRESWDCGVCG